MRYIKLFEDFKQNNTKKEKVELSNSVEGTLITKDDIIKCITHGGVIYATIIKDLPDNKPESALRPIDIDDGLITVEIDNEEYSIDLEDVEKIEYSVKNKAIKNKNILKIELT